MANLSFGGWEHQISRYQIEMIHIDTSDNSKNAQVEQLYLLQDHPDILWCLDMDRYLQLYQPLKPKIIIFLQRILCFLSRDHLVTCSEDQTICVYQSTNLSDSAPPLQHR